jgi:catalase
MSATADVRSQELVDAIADVYGRHEGHRAAHAKGTLCGGTFTATPEAAALSRAQHFNGEPVRTHVRFSNGSGDPGNHDGQRDGRGMAVKFYVDGGTTDIVCLNLPVFFVRNAEDFLAFNRARKPDPATGTPNMEAVGAFLADHPETLAAVHAALSTPPAASYLQVAYRSLHSFRLVDAAGEGRFVRYEFVPEAGEAELSDEDSMSRDAGYLQADLAERLAAGPATFTLRLQLAGEGDAIDDPTVAWPEDRVTVDAGRLEIDRIASDEREQGDDVLVFDPTRVIDGVELSGDAILQARRGAYAHSVLRRSGVALGDDA